MATLFHVTGGYTYVDPHGEALISTRTARMAKALAGLDALRDELEARAAARARQVS